MIDSQYLGNILSCFFQALKWGERSSGTNGQPTEPRKDKRGNTGEGIMKIYYLYIFLKDLLLDIAVSDVSNWRLGEACVTGLPANWGGNLVKIKLLIFF